MSQSADLILPNRIYPIGASHSPNDVFVVAVDKGAGFMGRDVVRYHDMEYGGRVRQMEMPGFLSLCSTAMKTCVKRYESIAGVGAEVDLPKWMAQRLAHYRTWLNDGRNDMPELNPADHAPETFRPMQAVVTPKLEQFVAGQGRSSDPWYAAEEHGSVASLGEGKAANLKIYLKKRALGELYADKRFEVIEVTPEFKDEADALPSESCSGKTKAL